MLSDVNNIIKDYEELVKICNDDETGMLDAYDSVKKILRLSPVSLKVIGTGIVKTDTDLLIGSDTFQIKEVISCYGDCDSDISRESLVSTLDIEFATKDEINDCLVSTGKYFIRANELFLEEYDGIVLVYVYPQLVWNNVLDDLLSMFVVMRYKEIKFLEDGNIKGSSTMNYLLSSMINLYNVQVDSQCGIDVVESVNGL